MTAPVGLSRKKAALAIGENLNKIPIHDCHEIPSTAVGGIFKSDLHVTAIFSQIPPTAVGGLFRSVNEGWT
jgi:hypothetical protein